MISSVVAVVALSTAGHTFSFHDSLADRTVSDAPIGGAEVIRVEPVHVAPVAPELSLEEKTEVLDRLIRELNARYVDEVVATRIGKRLLEWKKTGEFRDIKAGAVFASKVNDLMEKMVTDAHLRFRYSSSKLPVREDIGEPSDEEVRQYEETARRSNYAFRKVEVLSGNVGYLRVDGFHSGDAMRRPLEGAMSFLAETEALILDLRYNGGGSPDGVRMLCSYFFGEEPVHLNSLYFRQGDQLMEFWTLKELGAPRYVDKPVYVLVSKRTGSAAEECSYNLQQLKRGVIVGKPTWGGANPGGVVRISDHFSCFIPEGKAINPISKTNWEGSGVIPDVEIGVEESLDKALELAKAEIAKKKK